MDTPLIIISGLLFTTLVLFFLEIFPYPFGVIILTLLLVSRIMMLLSQHDSKK